MTDQSQAVQAFPFHYQLLPPKLHLAWRANRTLRKAQRRSRTRGEQELALLPFLVRKDAVSIDIGANRGNYTYFLSRLCKHVYAYEPNPWCADFLERAAPSNCTLKRIALSNESGVAHFSIPYDRDKADMLQHNIGTLSPERSEAYTNREMMDVEVATARLDDENISDVGFIKVDVERHEKQVLEGALKTIERERPVLLVEILDARENLNNNELIDFVCALGYDCFFLNVDMRLQHVSSADPSLIGRNAIFFPLSS